MENEMRGVDDLGFGDTTVTDAEFEVVSEVEETVGEARDVEANSESEKTADETDFTEDENTEGADVEASEDADDARQARHSEFVANLGARFAALVARGESIMAALDSKADAVDADFEEGRSKADSRIGAFAAKMQARATKASERMAADLDSIARSIDERNQEIDDEVPVDVPSEQAEPLEDVAPAEDVASCEESPYRPQFTEGAREFRERMRVGSGRDLLLTDPEFVERFGNFAFDDVPSDVDLPDRTRFMCWLATLLGCQGIDEYRVLLPAALNVGLEPEAIKEIVYQAVAYLGIGRVYPFLKATNEVFIAAGIELPLKSQATTEPTEESRLAAGEEAQVACFGEQMRGYKDRGAADYPYIAQWLVKNCFGDWYTRGGLTVAEREMCTFCYIAAQGGCETQLKSHVAANVNCGNDREFLIKVASNNVPFVGYPRSLNAIAVVEEATGPQ